MPVTRSVTRATSGMVARVEATARAVASSATRKRKTEETDKGAAVKKSRASKKSTEKTIQESETKSQEQAQRAAVPTTSLSSPASAPTFLPAKLSFSFHEARNHLIKADPRFEDVFNKMKCRPFEHLEQVDPFR